MARIVVATWYVAHVGASLFCGGTYDTSETWVALPLEADWECGEPIALHFQDGAVLVAPVRDTGPFRAYCVIQPDGACPSIGADVPKHVWPVEGKRSALVEIVNLAHEARRMGMVQ